MMKREVGCSIPGVPVTVKGALWGAVAGMVLALGGGIFSPGYAQSASSSPSSSASLCPQPALSRLTRHTIAQGETIESIAQTYNLLPATLLGFNAALRNGTAPVGTEIVIPPYNGVRVEAPAGSTWRQLATVYSVRADALFEANGCQNQVPSVVFVPGVNWSPTGITSAVAAAPVASNPLSGYPLPSVAPILTHYGWQVDSESGEMVFQTGVNLTAGAGTSVLAAGSGTVAFAGQQGDYGKLVVVNHSQGLQTRYAGLGNLAVQTGQTIKAGDRLGTLATGATYLHFEVRSNSNLGWVAEDPGRYIETLRSADLRRRTPASTTP